MKAAELEPAEQVGVDLAHALLAQRDAIGRLEFQRLQLRLVLQRAHGEIVQLLVLDRAAAVQVKGGEERGD